MTHILAIDTATEACSAALSVDGEIYEQFEIAPRQHARMILPMIDHLLKAADLRLADIDAFALGQGPGSFMGLRIAASVVQSLAFVARKPVIPISTLQVIAQVAHFNTGAVQVVAGWDARMEEVYWGAYQCDETGIMQPVQPDQLSPPQHIVLPDGHWEAAGNAWSIYSASISTKTKAHLHILPDYVYPHAYALVRLANRHYTQARVLPAEQALPVYLRDNVANTAKAVSMMDKK